MTPCTHARIFKNQKELDGANVNCCNFFTTHPLSRYSVSSGSGRKNRLKGGFFMPEKWNRGFTIKRTAIYIDGYNLYYGRLRGTPFKWLDIVKLFEHILTVQDPESSVIAVKLFTAYALAKFATHGQASVEAQQAYHRALILRHPERLHITLGSHSHDKDGTLLPSFVEGSPYNRDVRSRVWKIEEKQTDVNLAISMYRDASKGLFDHLVLCSNDSDSEPALKAIREDFPHITIGVVTPIPEAAGDLRHRSISASLSRHAHWTRRHILDAELSSAQLPPHIPTKKKPVRKPQHW